MYVPRAYAMSADEIRPLVEEVGSAELITVGEDGFPRASRLPVVWSDDLLLFHMAVANPHWGTLGPQQPALAVVTGPEAYVSPSWYPAKAEHGRVVPTWNYSAVHFTGYVTVHRDPDWLAEAVTLLTDHHERGRDEPWKVTDAPESFVAQQLRAVVGIEMTITSVEAKAKRSQNRSDADRRGVVAGLSWRADGQATALADQMRADLAREENVVRETAPPG